MEGSLDLSTARDFATALLIGALIGVEREKRKGADTSEIGIGGLRTFILIAEVGAVAGWISRSLNAPWLLVGALAVVAVPLVAGYVLAARQNPTSLGLTTEIAALAVCLLGGLTTLGHRELAIGLAVVTAAVLAYKQPLHGLVDKLGWDDVFAGVRLLIATFIVLPLLPNRPIDPWGALNPHSLWLLVLLIAGLSLIGYVATRWLGTHRGSAITGVAGGMVSSTAVTLSFARRSRDEPGLATGNALACGILLAWCVMFVRIVVEVLVVNRDLLVPVLIPCAVMGVVAGALAWIFLRRSTLARRDEVTAGREIPLKNPFSLTNAAKFAAFFAVVLLVVKLAQKEFSSNAIYLVSALAGATEVDAITLSMAEYAKSGETHVAVSAIIIAALSNTLTKCVMVLALGGSALRGPILVGTVAVMGAGIATILLL